MKAKRANRGLRAALATGVLGLVLAAGCSEDASSPLGPTTEVRPGELSVSVSGPMPGSTYLLTVSGPGITGATAAGDAVVYSSMAGSELKAAIVSSGASSGEILHVSVRDLKSVADYRVRLLEVADQFNDPADPALYAVSLAESRR